MWQDKTKQNIIIQLRPTILLYLFKIHTGYIPICTQCYNQRKHWFIQTSCIFASLFLWETASQVELDEMMFTGGNVCDEWKGESRCSRQGAHSGLASVDERREAFPAHNTVQAGFSQANGESLNQNYPLKESSDPSKWKYTGTPIMLSHWLGVRQRRCSLVASLLDGGGSNRLANHVVIQLPLIFRLLHSLSSPESWQLSNATLSLILRWRCYPHGC